MTTIEQKAEQRRQAKRSRTRTTQRAAKRRIDTDRNLEIVRFLNDTEVGWRYGISRPSVWRWVKTGLLPEPEALGPNTKRWRVATLDERDDQRETQQQTITPVLAGQ